VGFKRRLARSQGASRRFCADPPPAFGSSALPEAQAASPDKALSGK